MNRFKWFDFLGALILLFSVTKSALALQGGGTDHSEISTTPSKPADQLADSYHSSNKDASELEDDVLNPSVKLLLEGSSRSLSLQDGMVGEVIRGYDDKSLPRALTQSFAHEHQGGVNHLHSEFDLGVSHAHSCGSAPVLTR